MPDTRAADLSESLEILQQLTARLENMFKRPFNFIIGKDQVLILEYESEVGSRDISKAVENEVSTIFIDTSFIEIRSVQAPRA